jgi:hypothetical protein
MMNYFKGPSSITSLKSYYYHLRAFDRLDLIQKGVFMQEIVNFYFWGTVPLFTQKRIGY